MATQTVDQNQAEKSIFRATPAYKSIGKYLHGRELFDQAKFAYDEAYKSAVDDADLLTSRSRLCTDTLRPRQAVKDATDALAIDPRNLHAIRALANANYSMLEFEKSITLNLQGLRRRKKPSYFRVGANRGIACINDTIGKNSGDILTQYLPIIKENAKIQQDLFEPVKRRISRIPCPKINVKKIPLEIHRQQLMSRVLAYKYLEPLACDKFFLQNLIEDPRLMSANKENSKKLKQLAKDALTALTDRQDMLHAQCLYYTLQRKQKSESQYLNKHKEKLLANEREMNRKHAQQLLRQIADYKKKYRINDLMKRAQDLQRFFTIKTTYTFPDKDVYVDQLYRLIGEGYLSQHRLSNKRSDISNRRRVAFLMGLRSHRPTSFDSVINNYPQRYDDPKTALKNAMLTLETVENANMKCWLYYEISQLQCILKNYPLSKFYAQQCQREAEQISNHVWWLNGCFSLISSDVQQGNVNEVKNLAEEAYEWAKKVGKSDETVQFLHHCIDLANEVAEYDFNTDMSRHKSFILNVLDKGLRKDTELLFNKISTVPNARQFSVLPQKDTGRKTKESARRRYTQRHLTILPGPAKTLPRFVHTPIPGLFVLG